MYSINAADHDVNYVNYFVAMIISIKIKGKWHMLYVYMYDNELLLWWSHRDRRFRPLNIPAVAHNI